MGLLDGRKAERFEFNEEVIIDEMMFTNCVDISSTGLFVHTIKPFRMNSIVWITIPSYDIHMRALVKHVKTGIGLGLEFQPENDVQIEQLSTIIKNLTLSQNKAKAKPTILMIDSQKQIRSMYKNRLLLDGFAVAEVEDGMDAVRKMNSFKVDAVLAELEVKRIDLKELITIIRDAPAYGGIPIYVVANPSSYDIESWVIEAGATKYIIRSGTSPAQMSRLLSNVLKK